MNELIEKILPLSWSRIQLFLKCPRAWWSRYIEGIKEEETSAMLLGTAVHEAIKNHIMTGSIGTALENISDPDMYNEAMDMIREASFLSLQEDVVACEMKFASSTKGNPTDFDNKDAFIRGIVDLVSKTGDEYEIADWKTGWSKPDPRQLFVYARALKKLGLNVTRGKFFLLRTGTVYPFIIGENELEVGGRIVKTAYSEMLKVAEKPEIESKEYCSKCSVPCRYTDPKSWEEKLHNAIKLKQASDELYSQIKTYMLETEESIPCGDRLYKLEKQRRLTIKDKPRLKKWLIDNGKSHKVMTEDKFDITDEDLKEFPEEIQTIIKVSRFPVPKMITEEATANVNSSE